AQHGMSRPGSAEFGKARQARLGVTRLGNALHVPARQGRAGAAEHGEARRSTSRHGDAWRGKAWRGRRRSARRGTTEPGSAGLGMAGMAWPRRAGPGPGEPGWARARPGGAGNRGCRMNGGTPDRKACIQALAQAIRDNERTAWSDARRLGPEAIAEQWLFACHPLGDEGTLAARIARHQHDAKREAA